MAALVVTEAIANNMDNKRPSFVAALDVKKAFDVVCHPILKKRIFLRNPDSELWPMMSALLDGNTTKIRLNNTFGAPISSHGVLAKAELAQLEITKHTLTHYLESYLEQASVRIRDLYSLVHPPVLMT